MPSLRRDGMAGSYSLWEAMAVALPEVPMTCCAHWPRFHAEAVESSGKDGEMLRPVRLCLVDGCRCVRDAE